MTHYPYSPFTTSLLDLPMVFSKTYVGITDPHRGLHVVREKTEGGAGKRVKLAEFMKHSSHIQCLSGVFEMKREIADYPATLFRFPLRNSDSGSRITQNCYTPEKVRNNLFASLKEEAPILLLFLKKVVKVSMYEWSEQDSGPVCTFSMNITGDIARNRDECTELAKGYDNISSRTSVVVSSVTTATYGQSEGETKSYNWLLMNAIGSDVDELREHASKASVLPWVGIAAPTPTHFNMETLQFLLDNTANIQAVLPRIRKQVQRTFRETCDGQTNTDGQADQTDTAGQAFCFLPLPGSISLPVNLHGYFAVADNRRSIKWPSHDENGEEAKWNELLLIKLVAPLYALMLACRSFLVEYSGQASDAYAAWPVHAEVKNQQIWSNILEPVLDQIMELPILWAETRSGWNWVQLKEAHFIHLQFPHPPKIVLDKLVQFGYAIVNLPEKILDTLLSYPKIRQIVTTQYVTPVVVRDAIRGKGDVRYDEREDAYHMLRYVLSDQPTLQSLRDLCIVPLSGTMSSFAYFTGKQVFLFPQKDTEALNLLPGISAYVVDVDIPLDLQLKLEELATQCARESGLTLVTPHLICNKLIPMSMNTWCSDERLCVWRCGKLGHPTIEWINNIWRWIQTHQVLHKVCSIPLVPTEVVSASTEQVRLVPLDTNPGLCTLPTERLTCIQAELLSVVKKVGLVHIPKNEFLLSCPGTEHYIVTVDAHFLLKHIVRVLQSLSFTTQEKDALREYITHEMVTSTLSPEEVRTIKMLPIFKAGVGGSATEYVALSLQSSVLPPRGIMFEADILYPPNILSDEEIHVSDLLEKKLSIERIPKVDDFCQNIILPHIAKNAPLDLDDQKLVMWVLKCPLSRPQFLKGFSIIDPCIDNVPKKPTELYDPKEEWFYRLYNRNYDAVFPDGKYDSVLDVLRKAGLITWSQLIGDHQSMITFLADRVRSISKLTQPAALKISVYLLQLLKHHNLVPQLSNIPFLFPQEYPPENYPTALKWYGQSCQMALCPQDMCCQMSQGFVAGSVLPVLSAAYKVHEQLKGFHSISAQDIVGHFREVLQYTLSPDFDVKGVHSLVMKVYDSLLEQTTLPDIPETWIWWRSAKQFLTPNQCVHILPADVGNLEPHLFNLSLYPELQMRVMSLLSKLRLEVHQSLSDKQAVQVLRTINVPQGKALTSEEIHMALDLLNWLKNQDTQTYGEVLIPTSTNTLASASDCTYDDRSWSTKVPKQSKYTFVHASVSPALAKQFKVTPLSRRVAPSKNLKIKYTKAGQKEPVTRRIKRIVDDYATRSDIFKELLQNADDARATEVKFLIDWREHPTNSLFTDELAKWQGPALIAYNNAVFSDQDLDHICELAGETKMKDPLKTGRFGVGFCATYRLTDVPSFISRRFFTMFDPHTTYLGDRVSAGEPGMRVDLVENKEDLTMYEDQFKPYNGLFGCEVFNLSGDGFQGTLFRFPFRSFETASNSNVCQEVIDAEGANELLDELSRQASHIMLFLKHIQKVSVYVLNKGGENMEEKMELTRMCACLPTCKRLNLLTPSGKHLATNTCHTTTTVVNQRKEKLSSNWVVCSAVTPLIENEKERGLVPFAEVAIKYNKCGNGAIPLPVTGYSFCFLPLPAKTGLLFHVNGLFEISRDRSSLKYTDDGRFGKEWNDSLCKEPLMNAYITAVSEVARSLPVSCNERKKYLRDYYDLFKLSDKVEFNSLCASVKLSLPNSEKLLFWSDVKGGCWLKPRDVVLLEFSDIEKTILQEAYAVMLKLQYNVSQLPRHVSSLIMELLRDTKHVFHCEDFYTDVLLPRIVEVTTPLRDKHIVFLLKRKEFFLWIEPLLIKYKFVPVKHCTDLVHPTDLIDERQELIASLFDTEEGRFPQQYLQDDKTLMFSLAQLGMPKELSVEEITRRAKTVIEIEHSNPEKAIERSWKIVEYVRKKHNRHRISKLADAVSRVPFLPVAPKPQSCKIPWWEARMLVAPHEVFIPKWNNIIFSVCPVVDPPDQYSFGQDVLTLFGTSPKPPVDLVVSHLLTLSEAAGSFNEEAMPFLSNAMKEVYNYLHSELRGKDIAADIEEKLREKEFIWQDNKFLKADQVVVQWGRDHYPFLCELSSDNSKCKELFGHLGVKDEPSADDLVSILRKIAHQAEPDGYNCHIQSSETDIPVSDQVIDFIEEIVKRLSQLLRIKQIEPPEDLFLPDENCVMRPVKCLACDKVDTENEWVQALQVCSAEFEEGNLYFIHSSIPRDRAITLGAKPLLDTLLQGLEVEGFMAGLDYGQHEDLCDRLRSILRKYPADYSILNEFVQNADDAGATEILFVLDHRKFSKKKLFPSKHKKWQELQEMPALLVVNNSEFTENDIIGIAKLGRGGKRGSTDTIGRFGIGFNVAYHVTDCPSFVTFSKHGEPENFCVFDPTLSFANTTKVNPGKRWKINSQVTSDLPDQFQPYLLRQIPTPLPTELDKQHVVFRLPLTRISDIRSHYYSTFPGRMMASNETPRRLSSKVFSSHDVAKLFEDMARYACETLLFLNHVHKIAAVEIKEDGKVVTHFSTCLTMSDEMKPRCTEFSNASKDILKKRREPKELSVAYEILTKSQKHAKQCQKWLVCKRFSPKALWWTKAEENDVMWSMRPIGGVAAPLETTRLKGSMFCFLPMPMKSGLSVHVNGHFLVDDSRKHLEKIHKDKLSWNELLSANVIAPCYVDMLLHAQQMTDGGEAMADWFYNLFPKLSLDGEVGNLSLPESVYRLLHKKNPAILLQKHPATSHMKWLTLCGKNKGYFFHTFVSEETRQEVTAVPKLHRALVQLEIPVCTNEVPKQLYTNLKGVSEQYTALVSPELIIQYVQNVVPAMQIEDVLTVEILQLLLKFIIEAKKTTYLKWAVAEAPLLRSYDNQPWKGKMIFKSRHALLLPHCLAYFVLPEIEESQVGEVLAKSDYGIIVDLTVRFVHDYIQLFDIQQPTKVCDIPKEEVDLVRKLWFFLKSTVCLNIPDTILEHFPNKPLIPADDGKLYPMTHSATVLCDEKQHNIWHALKKLGYPNLSFKTLQIDESYAPGLVNSCSSGNDIIRCMKLKGPPNQDAELTPSQVRCIVESVREHSKLTSIRGILRNLKIFKTVSGAFVSMKTNLEVFVVPQGVPRYGIERIQESCRESYMILDAADDFTMTFYQQILSFSEINEYTEKLFFPTCINFVLRTFSIT